ncbi:MAG: hypothetical protein R6W73_08360 [Candidatus Saliniplasma sp.]
MKKISVLMAALLVTVSFFSILGISSEIYEEESNSEESVYTELGSLDVPTWDVGTYWTYHQDFWVNSTEDDDELYLEERLTYTVSSIEYVELDGIMTPMYVLDLDGEVLSGEGDGQAEYEIEEGYSEGHLLCRMDDHGVLEVEQFKYLEGEAMDSYDMEITMMNTNNHDPVVENYDFPLSLGGGFWANNTLESEGYTHVKVGGFVDDNETHDDSQDLEKQVSISDENEDIEVPSGNFDSVFISEEVSGDDEGTVFRYYNGNVQSYVREEVDLEEVDWIRVLEDYHIEESSNTLALDPAEGSVGDNITVSGSFPDHPAEDVSVSIPMAELQEGTTTDDTGHFSFDIEIPYVQDNTPSMDYEAKVGLISEVGGHESYMVSSIVIHDAQETQQRTLDLDVGWNFISMELLPEDTSIQSILDCPDNGISGQYSRVMYYDSTDQEWSSYKPGREEHFNGLEVIDDEMGIWIKLDDAADLIVTGYVREYINIQLDPGWNMVGYNEHLGDLPEQVTMIGYHDASAENEVSYTEEVDGFSFNTGEGYWIHVEGDETVYWNV